MLDGSSELKSENGEESVHGIIHVRNQVTLNDNTIYVFEELYIDILFIVWVAPSLYFVFQMHKKTSNRKKKMKNLILISFVAINCFQLIKRNVLHIFPMPENETMKKECYRKCK